MLKTKTMCKQNVAFSAPHSMNTCKGVISSPELQPLTDEEVVSYMSDKGVIGAESVCSPIK